MARKERTTVSVCLPARDEAATIGPIVGAVVEHLVERHPLVDEVVVVDDGSTDATAEVARNAGAEVVGVDDVLPGSGRANGKGEAMWKSLAHCRGELVVWCDADVVDFDTGFVTGVLGPLLTDRSVGFVKASYRRDLHGRPDEGGRVTELLARPVLRLLFPHLAGFRQPLAGECAGRRSLLEQLRFAPGYGVDLALLVQAADRAGVEAVVEVDLGHRIHRNRPLHQLRAQAEEVLATALELASGGGPAPTLAWRPPLTDVAGYRPPG